MASTPKGIDTEALHELIAVRAYQIWEEHGRPQGCAALHWREAEQDIMACVPEGAPGQPVQAARPPASRAVSSGR